MSGKTPKRGSSKCCSCRQQNPKHKQKQQQSTFDTLLQDINYIKQKLQNQPSPPKPRPLTSRPTTTSHLLPTPRKLLSEAPTTLYSHIIDLYKENTLLKHTIESFKDQLKEQQQYSHQLALQNRLLKQENFELQQQLLVITKPQFKTYGTDKNTLSISQGGIGNNNEATFNYQKYSTIGGNSEPQITKLNQQFERLIAESCKERNERGKSSGRLKKEMVRVTEQIRRANEELGRQNKGGRSD